jgi:signal transduction histidine kinase
MTPAPGIPIQPDAVVPVSVLRAIAHEIRQPLSTIESIAYYLILVLPRGDGRIHDQLTRLSQLVEQSDWILSSGLHHADPLPVAPEPVDLENLIRHAISTRGRIINDAVPLLNDAAPRLEFGGVPLVRLDSALGRALIDGLLTLFQLLVSPQGSKSDATELSVVSSCPVTLRTSLCPEGDVLFEIFTASQGYRTEVSLGPGAVLGLESARRIVTAHGGTVRVDIDPESGVQVGLKLPCA